MKRPDFAHVATLMSILMTALMLSGCANVSSTTRQVMEDRSDHALWAQGIYTVRLDRWTKDVPDRTRLQIDINDGGKVYLVTGERRQYLGRLERQLPDTPLTTLFVDTGKDRFVIGWVDDAVEGSLDSISLRRHVGETEPRPVSYADTIWAFDKGSRLFIIPTWSFQRERWKHIEYVDIYTWESRPGGPLAPGERRPVFSHRFTPPIDTEPFYVRVSAEGD